MLLTRKSVVSNVLSVLIFTQVLSTPALAGVVVDTKHIVRDGDAVKFIVKATNDGDEYIESVGATCTVFDVIGSPLGTGPEVFLRLKPHESVYDTIEIHMLYKGDPKSASCRIDN